jgi:hypothetical protein
MNFFGGDDDDRDPINRAISRGFRELTKYELINKGVDRLFPSSQATLDEVDKRLSIRLKKRALGLPMSDDDYETATNDGLSFKTTGATAAFGRHLSQYVPAPDFLKGAPARGLMETSFPKTIAADAGEYLLSSGLRVAGGKYGGAIRGAGRFFGR